MSGPKPKPLIDRLMAKIEVDPKTGCWIWNGATHAGGYGHILVGSRTTGRRMVGAHRVSYELAKGEVPDGHDICHRCDTPACVNPDHLFAGTRKDNMTDMVSKGRGRKPVRTECRNGHEATPGEDCAQCRRANSKRHYARNSEKERERKRSEYWSNPDHHRARALANYYDRRK